MRKVLVIVLACILAVYICTSVKLELIDTENANLKKEIDKNQKENDKIKTQNLSYEDKIEELKEVNKDKWEKLESWTKTKEQVQQALS